ncbi:hypothetical protein JCM10212_005931 [Sporobolomyces blumeae]
MVRIASLAAVVAATFSLGSAITVPTTGSISLPAPPSSSGLDRRGLINLGALVGKGSLIELDVLANILGPSQCSQNALVGVQAEISIGHLLHVCACVEILNRPDKNVTPCPACPANAEPICGSGQCGCECKNGYVSIGGVCVPESSCRRSGGRLRHNRDGSSYCDCPSPYIPGTNGACVLPPSARARAARRARSQLTLDYPSVEGDDKLKCPDGERACPIGNGDGYECLDVTSTLDSCGGCPGEVSSVNCLTLPGAEGVMCKNSVCEIASCFPGWRYLNGRCHKMRA